MLTFPPSLLFLHSLTRQYAKLCDLPDFDDPALVAAMRQVQHDPDPSTHIERKLWEMGMLALFLEETGQLDDASEVLAVGAGTEPILYWLANRVGRVVATDIYGEGDFAGREATASMVDCPQGYAPFEYRQDRLEARWMDARRLQFPDESFDVVYSLSSIEHFGSPADIAQSAREIGRVLRPGGHAFVVTECFARHDPRDAAPVDFAVRLLTLGRRRPLATLRRRAALDDVFTPRELRKSIVEPSGLELMQPLDLRLSPGSWDNVARYEAGTCNVVTPTGSFYPHVLLGVARSVFTSVCLPMVKPRS